MSIPTGLPRRLEEELAALNESQLVAAIHPGSVVVQAGPGSGKTRTLVAKAAYTLESLIPPRRGLAAITYTRHAAQEIVHRLDVLEVDGGARIAAGTLHGWCLQRILRPFGPLVGMVPPGIGHVIDDKSVEWVVLLQQCLDEATPGSLARFEKTEICRIRRRMAAGITEDDRDPLVRAALKMEQRMRDRSLYDFDLMISEAFALLRRNPRITQLLASQFPMLIVDEYQDLGPVLHQIVLHLREQGGLEVAAFGDPDQAIMGFAGADPEFLIELASRRDFLNVSLNINYRCGSAIIAASQAAINGSRAYHANPLRTDPGVVELVSVSGAIGEHAEMTVMKIDELVANDVEEHRIAVLYPGKGALLDELITALDDSIYEYVHENDQRLPGGEFVEFIRQCAARAIAGPQPVGTPDITRTSVVPTIRQLASTYRVLHEGLGQSSPLRRPAVRLVAAALHTVRTDAALAPWISQLNAVLGLDNLASRSPLKRDRHAVESLLDIAAGNRLCVGDIAGALRVGKITLTTYHAAKGREWDFVILPGLIDGVMPRRRWNDLTREWVPVPAGDFEQLRRAFYVGLTRARQAVILVEGDHWLSSRGLSNRYGVSPFAQMVRSQLRRSS
ncbi:UvrD-helicase domain-containing protein [Micromonospora sp. CA-248260]|uniref:UvrD-helicase domain-containing protein n=1 Tax=Micromonospora sp. CA-248260 TaxID=3239962 RepID=UPI003D9498B5